MSLPSLENLRCFDAAVRASSFRSAARAVALTPAAFGQRIKQLEDQLGVLLFQRTTRQVSLTQAGLALVPKARETLESAARCLEVADNPELPPMELTIGTRHELGMSFVIPLHDALTRAQPQLSLHYEFAGTGSELLLKVRTREIDCAVNSSRLTDPLLDSVRLHKEEYALVASPGLLDQTPFSREEHAREHTLIDISGELPLFRYWRDAPHGGDRLRFKRLWRAGAIAPMRKLILEGRGVGVLPRYFIADDLEAGKLAVLLPSVHPLFDYFRLVFRADDSRRSVFEELAKVLLEAPLR